jgi:hypothetical protein
MADFVHQYVEALLPGQAAAGQMLGVNVYAVDKQSYVINLTVLTLLGTIMKTISAVAPQVTDQVWLDALNHALDASADSPWSAAILAQVDPNQPPSIT